MHGLAHPDPHRAAGAAGWPRRARGPSAATPLRSPTARWGPPGHRSWRPAGPCRSCPCSIGSKNFSPRGMVPWGRITTTSPASSARRASRSGVSERLPRSTGIPPRARASWPDHRGVEQLALGQEPHGPAEAGRHDGQGHHVEVAAVVGGQDDRSPPRHAVDAVDVEAGVREQGRGGRRVAAGGRARARPPWAPPAAGPSARRASAAAGPRR